MDVTQASNQIATITLALGPAFVCGFAIQQFMEIIINPILNYPNFPDWLRDKDLKKIIFGIVSFLLGLAIAFGINLNILQTLNFATNPLYDKLITAVFISAGTAGFNSVMKFLQYAKENQQSTSS